MSVRQIRPTPSAATPTANSPIKVTPDTKELVRYGAALFDLSQGEFVERAVADYLKLHNELIRERVAAVEEKAAKLSGRS